MLTTALLLGILLAASQSAGEGRWLLSRESPPKGEAFEAWLFLPECKTTADCPVEVTLVPSSTFDAWFVGAEVPCQQKPAVAEQVWAGCTPPTGVLRVCGKTHYEEAFDLSAVVVQLGAQTWERSLVTRTVTPDPGWQPGGLAIALITAAAGFLTGLAGFAGQRMIERNQDIRDSETKIILTITKSLLEEFDLNVDRLRKSIDQQDPSSLSEGGYRALKEDRGVLGFLRSDERASYLEPLEELYARIAHYNSDVEVIPIEDDRSLPVDQRPATSRALASAKVLLKDLEKMCSKARKE